jgi:hypothetical protein
MDDGHAWIAQIAAQAGLDAAAFTSRKHYTIPPHPVQSGAPFSLGARGENRELSNYWSDAAGSLDELVRTTPGATPVLTWPHHFDIATLITLAGAPPQRTIGVGQSPGDEWYDEPYWYVGPYPYPAMTNPPPLARGHWHTNKWVGAVFRASDFARAGDQRTDVSAFLDSAVAACRTLLGA